MTGLHNALYWFLSRADQITWRAKQFRSSRFLQMFNRNGLVALVHQLHPEPVYVSERNWVDLPEKVITGTLSGKMDALVRELVSRKMFISNPDTDLQELNDARERTLQMINCPTILYLMMAPGCNFACNYCSIPALAKQYGENLLSFEDAVAGIELWRKHI